MTANPISEPELTREEFCARFKARMIARTFPVTEFTDGGSIAEYAEETAPSYFDDDSRTDESPEELADTDISYWDD